MLTRSLTVYKYIYSCNHCAFFLGGGGGGGDTRYLQGS